MNKDQCIQIIRSAVENGSHPKAPAMGASFQQTSVIGLFTFNEAVKLLFIQKADIKGYPWANQMAFPGGHQDKMDRSTRDTALRELKEELGIKKKNVDVIGSLGHFQTINNKNIEAYIGIWNQEDRLRLDSGEISRIFHIPLSHLMGIHKEKQYNRRIPNVMQLTYPYEDILIWGVTAKIVYHLIENLLTAES